MIFAKRMPMTSAHRAMTWMMVFVVLWELVDAIGITLYDDYSLYQVVWMRYAVHLAFMVVTFGRRGWAPLLGSKRKTMQIARSTMMLVMPAAFIESTRMGYSLDAIMSMFWLCPLFTLMTARWLLGERVSPAIWAATAVGYAGALMVYGLPRFEMEELLLPGAMGLSLALYLTMTRVLVDEPTQSSLFYSALGVFVALTPLMPRHWITPPPHDIAVMVGVGLLGYGALYSIDRLTHAAALSVSSPFTLMNVPFVLGLRWAFSGHRPILHSLAGSVLIIGSSLFLWMTARPSPTASGSDQALQHIHDDEPVRSNARNSA